MKLYKADLHIHTALSPCADLGMSPSAIIQQAKAQGLSLIGITDHNSTRNALVVQQPAAQEGIFVLTGAEVTTAEEVHCLAFFAVAQQLLAFQDYLERHIIRIDNPDGCLGDQPVVDGDENIVEMVPYWLPAALQEGITAVQKQVAALDGIFIPAHVNRSANGIFAQLGFIPPDLPYDALEFTGRTNAAALRQSFQVPSGVSLIHDSDAHFPEQIGCNHSVFHLRELSFSEIRKALHQEDGRWVQTQVPLP